ncbi:MAG: AIR synthase-related protein [Candidatus Eisenbacteria bacterium]
MEATRIWEWLEAEKIEAGCKDLGAGGLGGASSELVLAGGFGADIDLDRVPRSDEPLLLQILCGGNQERFVWAIPEEHAGTFLSIFNERYELGRVYPGARAAVIGTVIAESVYRARWEGAVVCELSAAILEESPIAPRPIAPRTQAAPVRDPGSPGIGPTGCAGSSGGWNAAARAPIYRSYDQEVQGHALFRPGEADAGVCRPISGAALGIAVSVDGNPEYGSLDPYWGGVLSVLESARNVAAVGAEPLAITDCLNFGNPEDAVCLGDLDAALRGWPTPAALSGSPGHPDEPLPIVSGNVSLYNQSSRGRAIPPSPIVACFGILPDYGRAVPQRLCQTGDTLLLVGARARHWGRPERAAGGRVPDRPLADQVTEIRTVQSLAADGSLAACHDVSDGGILRTLFEMAVFEDGPGEFGIDCDLSDLGDLPPHELLLSETPGFVVEVAPERITEVRRTLDAAGCESFLLGRVTEGTRWRVRNGDETLFEVALRELHPVWARPLVHWLLDPASRRAETGRNR